MRSAVFHGKHDVRIQESPVPQPGRGEVLLKVMACGVCGTDVHIFEGDKGAADCVPPTILGHEFAGEVVGLGEGVQGVALGERVCVDPNDTCGGCYYCLGGQAHFCKHMVGYGTTADGGFAQYCKVAAKQVHKLADTVSYAAGAMAEPVSCCIHGIDMCDIKAGDTVLIIGGGMIGLVMLQLARLKGAARAALMEPVRSKRDMALRLGADVVIDPYTQDPAEALASEGVEHIAVAIECAGRADTIKQAMALVDNKGTVMMFGLTRPDDEVAIKPFSVFQKEITIRASYINPYTIGRAVELINSGRLDVTSMVNPAISLGELPQILSSAEKRATGKYVVAPWQE